jgi:hypothetical protein
MREERDRAARERDRRSRERTGGTSPETASQDEPRPTVDVRA